MVPQCDSASNMGWDASYHTAYLREQRFAKVRLNAVAKVQYKLRVAFRLNLPWYGSMEWNMEENFSMEWKIFSMEWKWNGRKLPVWNMEKSSSIPYHALTTQHNPLQNTLVHIVFVISNIRGIVVKLFFPPPVLLSNLRSSVHKDSYGSR